jgi:hypothetical protein
MELFFSSLAQSVGAIVGIFAAFIITKIISSQMEFRRKRIKVRKEINVSRSVRDRGLFINFKWFCEWQLEFQLRAVEEEMKEGKTLAPEEYYRDLSFPKFLPRDEVLTAIQHTIDANHRGEGMEPPSYGNKFVRSVTDEGQKIADLLVEALHQIRMSNSILSEVEDNPESSWLVTFSVIASLILFYVGLIYPLSFLPFEGNEIHLSITTFPSHLFSIKGLMLAVPSAIFSVIMIVFLWINLTLKYSNSDIEELFASTELGYYSRYFDQMLANEKEQAEWARAS